MFKREIHWWLGFVLNVLLVLVLGSNCLGATNTWTGSADWNWFNTNNWSLTNVPGDGDEVIIPAAAIVFEK